MTPQQVKDWLGVGDIDRELRPEIINGMADVEWPENAEDHMLVFTAFLQCTGPHDRAVWVDRISPEPDDPHLTVDEATGEVTPGKPYNVTITGYDHAD